MPPLLVVATLAGGGPLHAQVMPGYRGDHDESRAQFRAYALQEFHAVLADWIEAANADDVDAAFRLYTGDAFLQLDRPTSGRAEGRGSLEAWLDAIDEVRAGLSDFDASGNLAYGSVRVQLLVPGPGSVVEGTMMFLLRKEGRDWRIRSQVWVADPAPGTLDQGYRGGRVVESSDSI